MSPLGGAFWRPYLFHWGRPKFVLVLFTRIVIVNGMPHATSVTRLCSLSKPDNDARPTFLFGACASLSFGIPLATESVRRLAKQAYADFVLGGKTHPDQIKLSEWTTWLQRQSWFVHGEEKLAENFPLVVEHLLKPEAYRRRSLLDLMTLHQDVGDGYRAVADSVLRGLAGTILTTNFDVCLPKALNDKQPHIRHVSEVNRGPQDFNEFNIFARAQIVRLHGKAEQYTDRNLISETQALDPELIQRLAPLLLEATPLIVVGYRGAEPSIMTSLLGERSRNQVSPWDVLVHAARRYTSSAGRCARSSSRRELPISRN